MGYAGIEPAHSTPEVDALSTELIAQTEYNYI